ncbi:hypothetical protein BMS3Abin03_02813 [bacterium BMS3Abin03]|nr:hypothetical protein BMS3Abin03_02813 [bacterium BMS3Abin03]
MDDFSITGKRTENAFSELKLVNKYSGGTGISKDGAAFLILVSTLITFLKWTHRSSKKII